MSSILEALEKAEGERIRGTKPGLGSVRKKRAGRRLIVPVIAGAMVGLLLLNLAIWWFYLRVEPVEPATTPSASVAPAEPKPAATPEPPPQPPAAVAKSKPALSLREQLQRNAAPSARPLIDEAQVAPKPKRETPPPPARVTPKPLPAPAPAPVAPSAPAEERVVSPVQELVRPPVAAAAPTPSKPTSRAVTKPVITPLAAADAITEAPLSPPPQPVEPPPEEQIPSVWELPQMLREKVLQLKSSVHVYNEKPALRFVIINMHRYGEGDSLPPDGFLLKRIDRDGVVIDYGQGQVRLPRR